MRYLDYTVTKDDDGRQVENLLRKRLGMGTRGIRAAKFREDGIMLDGERVFTIAIAREGQTLSIAIGDTPDEIASNPVKPVEGPLDIVYEDEDLIILNKQAGVGTHPGPKHNSDTLGNYLMHYYQQTQQECLLHPVSRLDWDTTGLIIYAKNAYSQDFLQKRLHTDEFVREYVAICHGLLERQTGTIEAPIGLKGQSWETRDVYEGGKPARTHYRLLAHGQFEESQVSLVRLRLDTGRTHQIRIHLSHIGHPLIGDELYGGKPVIARPALHSTYLRIIHPVSKRLLEFESPIPQDMRQVAEQLNWQ